MAMVCKDCGNQYDDGLDMIRGILGDMGESDTKLCPDCIAKRNASGGPANQPGDNQDGYLYDPAGTKLCPEACPDYKPNRTKQDIIDCALASIAVAQYGSDIHAAAATLGARGGSSKSPAKQTASRNNGKLGGRPKKVIVNGSKVDFDAAVNLMDDEIRESMHPDFIACTQQEFIDEYCKRHLAKFGEEFKVD